MVLELPINSNDKNSSNNNNTTNTTTANSATNATNNTNDGTEANSISKLSSFNINNAHCFDPNEESKLRRVINAVGKEEFHEKIHQFAKEYELEMIKSTVSSSRSS